MKRGCKVGIKEENNNKEGNNKEANNENKATTDTSGRKEEYNKEGKWKKIK